MLNHFSKQWAVLQEKKEKSKQSYRRKRRNFTCYVGCIDVDEESWTLIVFLTTLGCCYVTYVPRTGKFRMALDQFFSIPGNVPFA